MPKQRDLVEEMNQKLDNKDDELAIMDDALTQSRERYVQVQFNIRSIGEVHCRESGLINTADVSSGYSPDTCLFMFIGLSFVLQNAEWTPARLGARRRRLGLPLGGGPFIPPRRRSPDHTHVDFHTKETAAAAAAAVAAVEAAASTANCGRRMQRLR